MKNLFAFLLLGFFGLNATAIEDTLSIGPGLELTSNNRVGNTTDGYSGDQITDLVPVGFLKWGPLMVNDKGLQLSIIQSLPLSLYLVTNLHGFKYSNEQIKLRDESVFFGGGFRFYPLSIYIMKDFEKESSGTQTRVQLQYPIELESWLIVPTLAYTHYDNKFVNHYFGVSAAETSVNFPAYSTTKAYDYFFNLRVFYLLNDTWEIYLMGEGRKFSKEITDSPTTTDDTVTQYILGVTYKVF